MERKSEELEKLTGSCEIGLSGESSAWVVKSAEDCQVELVCGELGGDSTEAGTWDKDDGMVRLGPFGSWPKKSFLALTARFGLSARLRLCDSRRPTIGVLKEDLGAGRWGVMSLVKLAQLLRMVFGRTSTVGGSLIATSTDRLVTMSGIWLGGFVSEGSAKQTVFFIGVSRLGSEGFACFEGD
mgnify:CR=1 FL=1